jgi:hypothetical protein
MTPLFICNSYMWIFPHTPFFLSQAFIIRKTALYTCLWCKFYSRTQVIQHKKEIWMLYSPFRLNCSLFIHLITNTTEQSPQLVKKFPAIYRVRIFITAFTSAHHWSVSWARCIQSTPSHPTSLRSILMLSSHIRLSFYRRLSPSGFPIKILYVFALSLSLCLSLSLMCATNPTHVFLLDLITLIINYLVKRTSYEVPHYAVFSSFVLLP